MTKLPIVSAKQVIRVLREAGFDYAPKRGKGSHIAMVKRGRERNRLVIVPDKKSLPRGTFRAILEQSGLTREDFLTLLNK